MKKLKNFLELKFFKSLNLKHVPTKKVLAQTGKKKQMEVNMAQKHNSTNRHLITRSINGLKIKLYTDFDIIKNTKPILFKQTQLKIFNIGSNETLFFIYAFHTILTKIRRLPALLIGHSSNPICMKLTSR